MRISNLSSDVCSSDLNKSSSTVYIQGSRKPLQSTSCIVDHRSHGARRRKKSAASTAGGKRPRWGSISPKSRLNVIYINGAVRASGRGSISIPSSNNEPMELRQTLHIEDLIREVSGETRGVEQACQSIGRASWREDECQYGWNPVVAA